MPDNLYIFQYRNDKYIRKTRLCKESGWLIKRFTIINRFINLLHESEYHRWQENNC